MAKPEDFDAIIKLCESGRPVVPLLGAGISVQSGIPTTSLIVDYLAKIKCYFAAKDFQPTYDDHPSAVKLGQVRHLELFGYPDPYELNDELWQAVDSRPGKFGVEPGKKADRQLIASLVHNMMDEHLARTDENAHALVTGWRALVQHADGGPRQGDLKASLAALLEGALPEAQRNLLVEKCLQAVNLEARLNAGLPPTVAGPQREKIIGKCLQARDLHLGADWRNFLKSVTRSDFDHIDAVFQVLVRGRSPGASHRQLAFLTRRFGWRLLLTINFDDLIERALSAEGLEPTVYDVWRSAELPSPGLVRGRLSVVKLHGSAYGLRVGESLDVPLKEAEKKTLCDYLGERPVLLIAGWSGQDQRMRDLVHAVVQRRGKVVWVYFDPDGKPPYDETLLGPRYEEPLLVPTHDAGAFLSELYARATGSHPVSNDGYPAQSQRPLGVNSEKPAPLPGDRGRRDGQRPFPPTECDREMPVHLFTEEEGCGVADCGSVRMSAFVSGLSKKHRTIWVDVGTFQSVAELVVEIIRQCGQYDARLPAVVLGLRKAAEVENTDSELAKTAPNAEREGEDDPELTKAVRRVHEALRRGPYVLALDELGAFGRPPTVHHGIPLARARDDVKVRVRELRRFVEKLVATVDECKDAYVCLSITLPTQRFRHRTTKEGNAAFQTVLADMKLLAENLNKSDRVCPHPAETGPARPLPPAITDDEWDGEDVLTLLSTFRRPRSIVALRQLVPPYHRKGAGRLDALLQKLDESDVLRRTEGGYYWMSNECCDGHYDKASTDATSKQLFTLLGNPRAAAIFDDGGEEAVDWTEGKALRCLARLVVQHRGIAEYYYSDLFLASKDAAPLFEYVYHQIAAIRYATILEAFLWKVGERAENLCRQLAPAAGRRNPVEDYIHHLRDKKGTPAEHVRRQRLNGMVALRETLLREEDFLLSHVPSDTLLRWVQWVREKDLECLTPFFYIGGPTDRDEADCLEDLTNRLLREEAKILREKTAYPQCIRVCCKRLHIPLAPGAPGGADAEVAPSGGLLEKIYTVIDRVAEEEGRKEEEWRRKRERRKEELIAVIDIALCWTRLGFGAEARRVAERLEHKFRDGSLRSSLMRGYFVKADSRLFLLDGWNLKNEGPDAVAAVHSECEQALEESKAGLALVGEAARNQEYLLHCCYFRTHMARAHALQGDQKGKFLKAFQEFDRAGAGLDLAIGSHRGGLAFCTLRLADALMLKADRVILDACVEAANKAGLNNAGGTASGWVSPAGKLFLRAGDASDTGDWLRRAATPWAADGAADAPGKLAGANALLTKLAGRKKAPIEDDDPRLRQLWEQARDSLDPTPGPNKDPLRALERTLAYWDDGKLATVSAAATEAVGEASQYLNRAEVELDKAERLLDRGRRNFHSWYLLNRLQAQLQFERLLLTLSRPPADVPTPPQEDEVTEDVPSARFLETTKAGLRAIRDAFDNIFTDSGVAGRLKMPLKVLWCQLLLACLCNACFRWKSSARPGPREEVRQGSPGAELPPTGEADLGPPFGVLWERWLRLNRSVGLAFLVEGELGRSDNSNPYYAYLGTVYKSIPRELSYSLAARAFVERHLKVFPNPSRGNDLPRQPTGGLPA
jgi:NAD-dependent SIR2 family protein deacetylase